MYDYMHTFSYYSDLNFIIIIVTVICMHVSDGDGMQATRSEDWFVVLVLCVYLYVGSRG